MLSNSRGFSLVEVIIAMLVFAGITLSGWAMFGTAVRVKTASSDKTAAYAIANEFIEKTDMRDPDSWGEGSRNDGKFYVEYNVNPPQVEVEVFYEKDRGKRIVRVVTAKD